MPPASPEARPATVKGCSTGGQLPTGEHDVHRRHGPVVQLGVHAALSRRRSRVQIPSGPPPRLGPAIRAWRPGRVAQLVERAPEKREVRGSMPRPTTGNAGLRISTGSAGSSWSRCRADGRTGVSDARCPSCNQAAQVEERPFVHYVDLPVYGVTMSLARRKHRMRCVNPSCPKRTWVLEDHRIAAKNCAQPASSRFPKR